MVKKLYVGSLSYQIDNAELLEIFKAAGNVASAKVISDSHTGQSKGFGFVEMESEQEAQKAIHELNGTVHRGRAIVVSEARPETRREGGGGGGAGAGRGGPGKFRSGSGGGGRGGNGGDRGDRWGGR